MLLAGRAGALGLAISLVSAVPEKVWYVTTKGYKPWFKPKPKDVMTNEEGGHTIWYDEQALLKVGTAGVVTMHRCHCSQGCDAGQ